MEQLGLFYLRPSVLTELLLTGSAGAVDKVVLTGSTMGVDKVVLTGSPWELTRSG